MSRWDKGGRGKFDQPSGLFGGKLEPGVKWLMIVWLVVFVGAIFLAKEGWDPVGWLAVVPSGVLGGKLWQFFTASLFFNDPAWLLSGVLTMYFSGSWLERTWGTKRFVSYYFLWGAVGHLAAFLIFCLLGQAKSSFPVSGAATVAFGCLIGSFCALFWNSLIQLFFLPIHGKTMFWIIAVISLLLDRTGSVSILCGLAVGWFYVRKGGFQWYRKLEGRVKERIRIWKIRRKYRNFKVVDSEMKELWDDLEERMNKKDRDRYIH